MSRRGALGARFWAVWMASTSSSFGNGLNNVALPLLAATLTRSPMAVAAVLIAGKLPWLVVAIPAGAYADRADRPRLMRAMDLFRVGLLAGVAVLVVTGRMTIAMLYVLAFATGVCDTFFAGSTQAVLPTIVDRSRLANANGLLSVGSTATEQTVGPALGGVLFSVSRILPFAVDAMTFLASAGFLLGLDRDRVSVRERVRAGGRVTGGDGAHRRHRNLWAEMGAAVQWYRHTAALCLVTGTVAVLAFCQAMVASILVLFALERLHLSQVGYGAFMAAVAVGNIVGGIIAARLVRRLGTATVVIAAVIVAAVGYLGAAATSSDILAALLLGLEAVAVVAGNVATISFRQRATPPEMQARVANVWRSIVWGVVPFGALAGGALGTVLGLRIPFVVAGAVQLGLAAVVARPLHRLVGAADPWSPPSGQGADHEDHVPRLSETSARPMIDGGGAIVVGPVS